jgi:hypothetical protein
MYGEKVNYFLQKKGNKWQITFPQPYAAGIYFITVIADGHTWQQKVIKQ